MPKKIMVFILILMGTALGEGFLVRTEDPSMVPGRLIRRIEGDLYLFEIKGESLRAVRSLRTQGILIEKNYRLRALKVPGDPCTGKKWDFKAIRAEEAWDITTGSREVYVGLADTGVDYNHPDLRDNLYRNEGDCDYDGKDTDGNGYVDDCYGINVFCYPGGSYSPSAGGCNKPDAYDDSGHGTHIAGIIGAVGDNANLIPGVNWKVKIVPCKFLDSAGNGDIAGELECLKYFRSLKDKGINIVAVNASYGDFYPGNDLQREELLKLEEKGILYITAAGNFGSDNDEKDFYPCNYDLPNQICVGSVGKDGKRSSFSHYGFNKVKIFAPGSEILSLKAGSYSPSDCNGSLLSLSGTSMATPFVTGAVALIKSKEPSLTYQEVRNRILKSARTSGDLFGLAETCGILDLKGALSPDNRPKPCLSGSRISYGTLRACGGRRAKITLRNAGGGTLTPLVFEMGDPAFKLLRNGCFEKRLSGGGECSVEIAFVPLFSGSYNSLLRIHFLESDPVTVALEGSLETREPICAQYAGCGSGGIAYWLSLGAISLLIILKRDAEDTED